ncbi:putative phage tail protein [Aneurinibacillus migulanus]|uniref:DUF2313 domain-containing protein n=2 Tax=Aneurinibacillus migulanus TaxID=47500 RepID=A0A1G8WEN5_ANEMI|nr:putative phage tail protein [Aneurinibacillus migulanus]MED0894877.1 DUF2313 domain-containing protein [Aneurinibacillus migulanus]MED1614479.1 DUF2313 domain-containing protein [Aneurinibacillus migulanus]GED14894.1 hypothetical protein AMI01nite_28850 [Aneurinibacillus migulanus]SDJ76616.1 hypothetical protein SAMN04487909_1288 [Aneurinibacillus migulanus]
MQYNYNEMKPMLSDYYENSPEMQAILEVQGRRLDELFADIRDVYAQRRIETATWTIDRHERIWDVTPHANDTLDDRRARVKAKILLYAPMTIRKMRDIINTFVPSKNAKVYNIPNEYAFEAQIPSDELHLLREIVAAVEKAKPAHLEFLLAPSTNETIEIQERVAVNIRRYHKVHEFRVGMKPMKYQSEEVL